MDYRDFPFEETFQEKHYQAITYNDPYYPKELFQLIDPPTVLYAMGDISLLSAAKIAIIGSRNATNYSEKALEYIVPPQRRQKRKTKKKLKKLKKLLNQLLL